ncbi:AAA family ATPase [[Eubacterium] cellulosolvens]
MKTKEFVGTDKYYLMDDLKEIVNIAMVMEKPLLLMGEAGTGKTQLAFEVARALGMGIEVARCKSTMKGEEMCYNHDSVLRLYDSRFGAGETGRKVENFKDYLMLGPIGKAFTSENRVVLLLDEIDKTESDVQDNLLDVLEENQFTIREIDYTIKAKHRPFIFITSNAKRELSDPFLRRCFCHYIDFPTTNQMKEIVGLHYPGINKAFVDSALNIFYQLREMGFEKPPATSELLDWIRALREHEYRVKELKSIEQTLSTIPMKGTLLKRVNDIKKFMGRYTPSRKQVYRV